MRHRPACEPLVHVDDPIHKCALPDTNRLGKPGEGSARYHPTNAPTGGTCYPGRDSQTASRVATRSEWLALRLKSRYCNVLVSDAPIRRAVFDWLAEQVPLHDDVLPWTVLQRGFDFKGERIPLVSMPGIFKPRVCELPLSIRTAVDGPYDDRASGGGRFLYAYRGTDPNHPDNAGLRELMQQRIPLIYFFGLVPARYLPAWPVFIIADDPARLTFTVQLDDAAELDFDTFVPPATTIHEMGAEDRRRYVTREFQYRIHQRSFRERVLRAYQNQCALCRLRHRELLDAAHIIPDKEGGDPRVPNGLSLCKLHHAAYDKHFIAVRPDGIIEVRRDILEEQDGPMLLHGLKRLHETRIFRPRHLANRPDPHLLEIRYARFLTAGSDSPLFPPAS